MDSTTSPATTTPTTYQVAQRPRHVRGADSQPFQRFGEETHLLASAAHTWAEWQGKGHGGNYSGIGGEVGILVNGTYNKDLSDAFRSVARVSGQTELTRYRQDFAKAARKLGLGPVLASVCQAVYGDGTCKELSDVAAAPTVDDIRARIAALEGELAALSGEGLEVWNGIDGDVRDCPGGGATVALNWCVPESANWCLWYPTVEAAKAKLLEVARANHRAPREDGLHVDLTMQGCHTSNAYVTRKS